MSPLTQVFTVMIRCPAFKECSNIATSVVEDELTKVVQDYSEIFEEGVPHGWMDCSYETQIRSRLFNDDGTVRITGAEAEFWNVVEKPEKAVRGYTREADYLMKSIMDHNHEVLLDVAEHYIIEEVVVARKFPEVWVLQVMGAQL